MRLTSITGIIFLTVLISANAVANNVDASSHIKKTSFTYTGLYKSLEASKKSEFSQLSLHFLLLDNKTNKRCQTEKIMLSDGETEHQVMVNDTGALLLPLDKKLKKDHAAISFETDKAINCHLSMQISVADFELETFSKLDMMSWLNQFEEIYSTLAGWPGRYFMPRVEGIALHVNDNKVDVLVGKTIVKQLMIEQGRLLLTRKNLEALPENSKLFFNSAVSKVLPTLEK